MELSEDTKQINFLNMRDPEVRRMVFALAREGDLNAIQFLKKTYSLRVWTNQELDRVNQLIKTGLTNEQAIKQTQREVLK